MKKLLSICAGLAIIAIFACSALFADFGSSPPGSPVSAAVFAKDAAPAPAIAIVPAVMTSNRQSETNPIKTHTRRAGKSDYYFQTEENIPGKQKLIRNKSATNPPEHILKNPQRHIPIYFDRRLNSSPRDAPST